MTPNLAQMLTQQVIYLMGASFLIGSLFTIFILLILDMMRARREGMEDYAEENGDEEA